MRHQINRRVFEMKEQALIIILAVLCVVVTVIATRLAVADLTNKTVVEDTRLLHTAYVEDSMLSFKRLGHQAKNWEWIIEQKSFDGNGENNDIQVRGRHLAKPHPGEISSARWVELTFYNVVPGTTQPPKVRNLRHPKGIHFDWLQVRYDSIHKRVSRLSFNISHSTRSPDFPPPTIDRRIPRLQVGLRILTVFIVAATGILVFYRLSARRGRGRKRSWG